MQRRRITIGISGAVTLLAIIIISVLSIDDWSGLTGWAFGIMLWSAFVFFSGLFFAEWIAEKTEQIVTRSALYFLIFAYTAINIPVSIFYIVFFKEAVTSFVIIEVVLHAVTAIAVLVFLMISSSIHQSSEKTMRNLVNIESMIERLNKLAVNPKCETYASKLKKLSEDLRFTDLSAGVPEDTEIEEAISFIETEITGETENASETMQTALVCLHTLIAKRTLSARAAKKGKI